MSVFVALKPCRVAGVKYIIDDEVDVSKLNEKQIASLIKRKTIKKVGDGEASAAVPALLSVPVITKDETLTLDMTGEQLCEVVELMQRNAETAIDIIKGITEESLLILIHRLDGRSTVQKAAKARVEELTAPAGDGE